MSFNEKKLDAFKQDILKQADEKVLIINQETQKECDALMEKANKEEQDRVYADMQEKVKVLKNDYKSQVIKARIESKNDLLKYRARIAENIMNDTKEKVLGYVKTDEYKAYLLGKMKKMEAKFPVTGSKILLQSVDMKYSQDILSMFESVLIEEDKTNKLGGFKMINEEKHLILDETFETLLDSLQGYFHKKCQLTIGK